MNYTLLTHPNSYQFSSTDALISAAIFGSGAPYAIRHGELVINKPEGFNKKHIVWHATLAFFEMFPVLGGVIAIVERAVVFIFQVLSNPSPNVEREKEKESVKAEELAKAKELERYNKDQELAKKLMREVVKVEELEYLGPIGKGAIAVGVIEAPIEHRQRIHNYFNDSILVGLSSQSNSFAGSVQERRSFQSEFEDKQDINSAIRELFNHIGSQQKPKEKININIKYYYVVNGVAKFNTLKYKRKAPKTPTSE